MLTSPIKIFLKTSFFDFNGISFTGMCTFIKSHQKVIEVIPLKCYISIPPTKRIKVRLITGVSIFTRSPSSAEHSCLALV